MSSRAGAQHRSREKTHERGKDLRLLHTHHGTGSVFFLLCGCALLFAALPLLGQSSPRIVTLSSPSPLIQITVMLKAGSIDDPRGKEGLAYLTAETLLQGGFGDPDDPVTKEELALTILPWGEASKPSVSVAKEVTTFNLTVPEKVLNEYLKKVFQPLFNLPVFQVHELERLRSETLEQITGSLRYEDIEGLGLKAIDSYVFEGTPYAHLAQGSVRGLEKISRDDLLSFYVTHYRADNLIVGLSRDAPALKERVARILAGIGQEVDATRWKKQPLQKPHDFKGRSLVIIAQPNAASSGIHAAFPIPLTRKDPDFWPLYVANVFLGTHRDSFSYLFREIRQKRGYNYGNYSYVEHFSGRPSLLFPPFNTPRQHQYFSVWIRPVAHQYTHHLMKALTWELENFVRTGMTPQQVNLAKNKAETLYLNLAETVSRLLGARVDDAYYDMLEEGYLTHYLKRIDAVTTEQINKAIKKYLQAKNIKYLVVTDDEVAGRLAEEVAADGQAQGKSLTEYEIKTVDQEGTTFFAIPSNTLEIIKRDAVWAAYPLGISRTDIRVAPVEQLFVSGGFLDEP